MQPRLRTVAIRGYRPFKELIASIGPLEVLVGANGSGKSSLFEFLRLLRDGLQRDIPPEIVAGWIGQQIFHHPGPQRLSWNLEIDLGVRGNGGDDPSARYQGELIGPLGSPNVISERAEVDAWGAESPSLLEATSEGAHAQSAEVYGAWRKRPNQLALSSATSYPALQKLRDYLLDWRFYTASALAKEKIRQPVFIEQDPVLREDGGNLSALLHYLYTEHPDTFRDLQQHLRSAIPGCRGVSVKARGGPGQVMAFWHEEGLDLELSLADLSDGTLHLLCWIALCIQPNPPSLLCIDEPDQGVHPRTLPLLAGLFEKASERTQILLATHSSYFLLQFGLERIAVLRKENGEARFSKPRDSTALTQNLEDFGAEEIELMHRSDELEQLA
jgi:predicted ATPase